MSYTFEQLKEDVRKEAEALKIHATKEERERLNFRSLKPSNTGMCIYGQMTDDCYSDRAAALIQKSCVRYFKHDVMPSSWNPRISMCDIREHVNGKKVKGFRKDRATRNINPHFSAIEAYILLPQAKNANLISFLRGETETLVL
jgi:hypothetical protein